MRAEISDALSGGPPSPTPRLTNSCVPGRVPFNSAPGSHLQADEPWLLGKALDACTSGADHKPIVFGRK